MFRKLIGDRGFYRRTLAIMLPILTQNVITNLVNLLDNLMVGQIGTEPMSGVAIVNQLLFVFNLCIFGGLAGAGIFTAQYVGKGDEEGVGYTVRAKIYIALSCVAVFALLLFYKGEFLISLFIHEGQESLDMAATMEYGREYLRVMMLQLLPFAAVQVYASTLRETGETALPMKAGIVSVFVNLFLNWVFIFGNLGFPAMGVAGAAIATVIARFSELAVVVIFTNRSPRLSVAFLHAYRGFSVPGELMSRIMLKGMPLFVNELFWSAGITILNQCYSMRGLEVVSACNISSTVANLFFCAFFAMGNTISIIVGQHLGAGAVETAVEEDRKLIALGVGICTVTGIVMVIAAPLIPMLYNTTDTVRALAAKLLTVNAVLMPLYSFTNSCYFTLRSGGKTMITFVFDSCFQWVICVPMAFVMSRYTALPTLTMFIIVQSTDILKSIFGYILVKKRKWVNNLVG